MRRLPAEPDQHPGGTRAHQMQGSLVGGGPADDDRNVQVVDELLQIQGLVAGGDMFGRNRRSTYYEEIHTRIDHRGVELLGALRREGPGHRDPGLANLLQTAGDQLSLDRFPVGLLNDPGRLLRRGMGYPIQLGTRVLVSGPQSLQIEHAQSAQPSQGDGRLGAGHRVHGRRQQWQVELVGIHLPGRGDILGIPGPS